MKRNFTAISMMILLVVGGVYVQIGEGVILRNACIAIPQRALDQAEIAIRQAHPQWNVVPVVGDNGEWRCKTNGSYVKKYDKIVDEKRVLCDISLLVDGNGSITIYDNTGCFSIDRWK